MRKQQAIELFGNGAKLAREMGISRATVSAWPDELPESVAD